MGFGTGQLAGDALAFFQQPEVDGTGIDAPAGGEQRDALGVEGRGVLIQKVVEKSLINELRSNRSQQTEALVARSRRGGGLLDGRLRSRCREARRNDVRGARGLGRTTGRSWLAASTRRCVARLLDAAIRLLLDSAVRGLLVATTVIVVLAATVVAVVAPTVPGLGIRGAEHQSERRGKHSQGQDFSRHCRNSFCGTRT